MTPAIRTAIIEAFDLLPPRMRSEKALVMMLSVAYQESDMTARRQFGNGPARGLWQFEQGGGVKGVLTHASTQAYAEAVCAARHTPATPGAVWASLEGDDVLAAAFARLLLYSDARSLPDVDDVDGGWKCYQWNWRPGRPHPEKWPESHAKGVADAQAFGPW